MVKLNVINLKKKYVKWELGPLSFSISDKQSLSILEPSGSGKSTLLRTICGIEEPDNGKILLDNRDITDIPMEEREIGMVFQESTLFPHMSVRENIKFGLDNYGFTREEKNDRIEVLKNIFHLERLIDRMPDKLSGGEKQRVAMARAIAVKPKFLLYDEPLSSIDRRNREVVRGELKAMQYSEGIQFIYVTHDHSEALFMGDYLAILNNGKIEQIDKADTLYSNPENSFVAWFLGYNILNINSKTYAIAPEEIEITEAAGEFSGRIISGSNVQGLWNGYISINGETIQITSKVDHTDKIGKKVQITILKKILVKG